jgi:adenylate cyclase class 2
MLEIELKFAVGDFRAVERILASWHAAVEPAIDEADHYFNAPDRDFGKTDEAFRLRRVGPHNRITYKGPKQAGPTKTRTEIELALADGAETADAYGRLVRQLGYRPTAVVRKRRVEHRLTRDGFAMQVCCDEVERVGRFVEVEIVAPEAERDRAQQVLMRVAGELGLDKVEPRSYLHMLLEAEKSG